MGRAARAGRARDLSVPGVERKLSRSDLLIAALLFVFQFAVFAATAARTVGGEDTGDFAMGVATLGVVHPPSYPLYTMLGYLFVQLPLPGSTAFHVALFSGLWGALAVSMLSLSLCLVTANRRAQVFAALAFGVTTVFWSQSNIPEVYSLNAFFVALLLFLTLLFNTTGDRRALGAGALTLGLGMSNHYPLFMLTAAGLVALVDRRKIRRRDFGSLIGLFALGLTPYLYLFAQIGRYDSAGYSFGRLDSVNDVILQIRRYYYRGIESRGGWADKPAFVWLVLKAAVEQYLGFTVLAIAGLATAFTRRWRCRWPLVVGMAGSTLLLIALLGFPADERSLGLFQPYPIPAYLLLGVFVALGIEAAEQGLAQLVPKAGIVMTGILAALLATEIAVNLPRASERRNRLVQELNTKLLESLPPDAILVACGDEVFPIYYLQLIEGLRRDVEIHGRESLVTKHNMFAPDLRRRLPREETIRREKQFIANATRPLYYTCNGPLVDFKVPFTYTPFVFKVGPTADPPPPDLAHTASAAFLDPLLSGTRVNDLWTVRVQTEAMARLMSYALVHKAASEDGVWRLLNRHGFAGKPEFLFYTGRILAFQRVSAPACRFFRQANMLAPDTENRRYMTENCSPR